MHPDLSKGERAIVCRALHNHAKALETEAKKLDGLGYPKLASQLSGEANHINDNLKSLFSDEVQVTITGRPKGQLNLSELATAEVEKIAQGGNVTVTGPRLVVDAPTDAPGADESPHELCEACDRRSEDVKIRPEWDGSKLCDTCVNTLAAEADPRSKEAKPWPGWNLGGVPPHRDEAKG